jgi:hypothetical protein
VTSELARVRSAPASAAVAEAGRRAEPAWERWRSRLAWGVTYALAGVALFALYLAQSSRGTYVTSDGASNVLQAWAMLHGNVLLRGWALSDVSFYTTDLPYYVLVEAFRGLRPEVVHMCGALTYTLLVLLAAALAKGRAAGREGVTRALVAAGIMLAPELGNPSGLLLSLPDHVGTGVPLLLTWLLIDRGAAGWGSRRWLVPVLAGSILAWTTVGDQLAGVIGALPLALVCAFRIGHGLWSRAGKRELRGYELSLLVAAVVSVPLAELATWAISAAGGWTITPVPTSLAAAGALPSHAYLTGAGILQLFGADFLGQPAGWQTAFALVHLAGLALAAVGLGLAMRRFLAAELVTQALAVAIVVNIAAYLFSVLPLDIYDTREIAGVLPFGAVLAGRLLAGRLARPGRAAAIASTAGAGLLAGYAGMLGFNAGQPPVGQPRTTLTTWLSAHHLTRGLGGYWQANSVTLISGDAVQVRPISLVSGQLIAGSYWDADRAWYDPATHYADFIVDQPPGSGNPRSPGPLIKTMEGKAGEPARLYFHYGFAIAVWKLNLLSRVHEGGPCGQDCK